jgi:hypothetical protein
MAMHAGRQLSVEAQTEQGFEGEADIRRLQLQVLIGARSTVAAAFAHNDEAGL